MGKHLCLNEVSLGAYPYIMENFSFSQRSERKGTMAGAVLLLRRLLCYGYIYNRLYRPSRTLSQASRLRTFGALTSIHHRYEIVNLNRPMTAIPHAKAAANAGVLAEFFRRRTLVVGTAEHFHRLIERLERQNGLRAG